MPSMARFWAQAAWWRSTKPRPPWMAARWKTTSMPVDRPLGDARREQVLLLELDDPGVDVVLDVREPAARQVVDDADPRAPLSTSRSIRCELMNEAPPVTRTCLSFQSMRDVS